MARRLVPGVGGGTSVVTLMIVGFIGGIITDIMWQSLGLPGYNVPLQGCDSLTVGDAMQMGGTGGLTFFGFLTKSRDLPAFTFGLMLGGMFPKVFTKAFNLPRYGIFDINESGAISPVGTFRSGSPGTVRKAAPDANQGPLGQGTDFISQLVPGRA
jgi:hypothetical protein